MNNSTHNVEYLIRDEILEAGILEEDGQTLSYFHNGREYLVSILAVDITDWQKEQ